MKEKLTIVKVGGKIVEDAASLSALIERFARIEGHKLLVHGGGRTATDIAAQMGVATTMVGGRRVTDANMLRIVTMVYGGLVNKNIVAQLEAAGICALGLTGADMDIIRAHRRTGTSTDYGFVGDVDSVDHERLARTIQSGTVPVLAPLTHDGRGTMLNTNADTIASETARALSHEFCVTLIYCFEHAGVLSNPEDPESVIKTICRTDFQRLVADGTVSGGMVPKLENCLAAVEAGVERIVITRADLIDGAGGTVIIKR